MGFDTGARVFHWLTAVLVGVTIPVGFTMTMELPSRSLQDTLFVLHKGLGPIILLVVIFRIIWRIIRGAPALPRDLPKYQRIVSSIVHLGLYVGLLSMAISGYVRVVSGGFPIELLNVIGIPPLTSRDDDLAEFAKQIHYATAWGLLALLALHIGAALYHHYVRRDEIMARMWPPFRGRLTG